MRRKKFSSETPNVKIYKMLKRDFANVRFPINSKTYLKLQRYSFCIFIAEIYLRRRLLRLPI